MLKTNIGNIRVRVWLAGIVGLACLLALVRLAISVPTDSPTAHRQDQLALLALQSSERSSEATSSPHESGKVENQASGSNRCTSALSVTSAVSNAGVAAEGQGEDKNLTPEEIAARKEKEINDRFGVIRRQNKWIPTIGGGSNLVYITTGALPLGQAGKPYEVLFNAESGSPPYQWRIIEGQLPTAFFFTESSGRLAGTPLEPSTTGFLLEVTDSMGAKDVAEYILVVQTTQELTIVSASLPAAYPGGDYSFQMQAIGGIPPYEWSAVGDLDAIGWLALDPATGYLYGQVTTNVTDVDIPIAIRLADSQRSVSKEFVLHVRAALCILDVSLPPLRKTVPFEFGFQAAGGLEPYAWGIEGTLPPGLTLSETELLSGTPTTSGRYAVSVWVQDALGQFAMAQCTLEVLPSLPGSISDFHALLSRTSSALKWTLPVSEELLSVRIVRKANAPPLSSSDGKTVYQGAKASHLDGDVGAGTYYYAAFLEVGGVTSTSAPPALCVRLPPKTEPFADAIVSMGLLHPRAFGSDRLPAVILGAPHGKGLAGGSADVLSLGAAVNADGGVSAPYGGEITLKFEDNVVWDGPGDDFTVFENVFYIYDAQGVPNPETRFMEPAIVSVSQDGVNWRKFNCDFSPRYYPGTEKLNLRHPYCYNSGFAGVNPVMSNGYDPDPTDPAVSGGDSFDISKVGLDWIRYVRIQSMGSRWLTDSDGDLIYHNEEMDAATRTSSKSGFDLDAITAIWMEKVVSNDKDRD